MPDFIVVGGGSAGCTVASRLSEDADVTVLLLEAGPRDTSPYIHLPGGFYKFADNSLTWGFETAPLIHADNRTIVYPQARVLGGGSSINAQVFTRGCPEDYDCWATEEGCAGWSFPEVLEYFKRSEDNDLFSDAYHGTGGPLGVSTVHPHLLSKVFVRAGQQLGLPYNPDFNGAAQEGVGLYQTTTRNGRRCSASVAYIRPALGRNNLTIRTDIQVRRVVMEGCCAIGVEIEDAGRIRVLHAEREIILCAGAIGSPKLLLLSGIGPGDALGRLGIPVILDLPGVGQNFQDHIDVDVVYELNGAYSYDKYRRPHWKLMAAIEFSVFNKGPVVSNIVEAGAFWWSDRAERTPDLQLHFLPGAGVEAGGADGVPGGNGVTLNSYHLRPRSRGTVTLRSADPRIMPVIDPNAFAEPYDLDRSVDGMLLSRELMAQSAWCQYVRREHVPGEATRTRQECADFVRRVARSANHPAGTCKMGVDGMAVVAPDLKVRGLDGLRVSDASIMPRLISSNTNAAAIMIGEKAADLIRGRSLQPR